MKTTYFFLLLFLMIFALSSKALTFVMPENEEWTIPPPVDGIHLVVDTLAQFPGGTQELFRFIDENLNPLCVTDKMPGRVTLQFTVLKTGEITDIEVVRGVDPLIDREAIRVVKSMPLWIPAKHNGEKVNSRFTLPVNFRLQ